MTLEIGNGSRNRDKLGKAFLCRKPTLWDGGDGLLVSSMVSDNSVVDEDGDFDPDWIRLTFLDSDLLEDVLDVVEVDNSGGHGHNTGGESLADSFHTDEELSN
jgi:hypothetical protein